jgi:hypothetical protein
MSKLLFIINDNGTSWKITGTRIEMDDNFVPDPTMYFETGSEDFFDFIKELVDGSNEVTYPKGIIPTKPDDFTITPLDSLSVYKARIRATGKHILRERCDFTLQFDFFQFQVLNNKMIDAGYVITDENREAKYLDIINTGDTDLINDLDSYLEIRDRVAISNHNYNNYLSFKTAVNEAADEAAVDAAFAAFGALYN